MRLGTVMLNKSEMCSQKDRGIFLLKPRNVLNKSEYNVKMRLINIFNGSEKLSQRISGRCSVRSIIVQENVILIYLIWECFLFDKI